MGQHRRHTDRALRLGAVVAVVSLVAGCSTGSPPDNGKSEGPESAALRVETVSGANRLDEETLTDLEGRVGDVLPDYVYEAFLGTFPRENFVQSFDSFTGEAAQLAAGKVEVLTAFSSRDATGMRATQLDARLSFLTEKGTVYAGSAAVDFAFEATMEDGSTRPLVLDGRIMLVTDGDDWQIFGLDVHFDDGIAVEAES